MEVILLKLVGPVNRVKRILKLYKGRFMIRFIEMGFLLGEPYFDSPRRRNNGSILTSKVKIGKEKYVSKRMCGF